MSLLPLVQQPCPYIDRLDSMMEGVFAECASARSTT